MPRYRTIAHTADLGAYFYGRDVQTLYINAALALFDLICEKPPRKGQTEITISVKGVDREDLLVRWLSELVFHFDAHHEIAVDVHMEHFSDTSLKARVITTPFDPAFGIRHDIKAVTYHQVEVRHQSPGWRAKVIFDL